MTFWQKMFSFKGRIRRRDFWLCTLVLWGIEAVAYGGLLAWYGIKIYPISAAMQSSRDTGPYVAQIGSYTAIFGLGWLAVMLLTLWPNLALNGKRLHDRGRSAGVTAVFYLPFLFAFIPAVGQLLTSVASLAVFGFWLVDLGILDGDQRGNTYGPSPKLAGVANPAEVFA